MNQYPVLFMSFKDVEAEDFNGAYKMLISRLADVCKGLTDINKNELFNPADRDIFERLMYNKAEEDEIKNSLKMILGMQGPGSRQSISKGISFVRQLVK